MNEIILVTSRGKSVMEDHFDISSELEDLLAAKGKAALLEQVRKVSQLAKLSTVRQGRPLGLGHAVLMARDLVGDEPFAVVLGDDIFHAEPPALKQMADVFERALNPVVAVERVPESEVSSYGILAVEPAPEFGPRVHRILDMVEKPRREDAPSTLAIIGRYLLTPDIFPALEATASDKSGEIQLTNGMKRLLQSRPFYALEVDGVRHDAGNKLGFLKATAYFALQRPDLADEFTKYLKTLGFSR
jgi:UTP--glucose-1-phosphate uridylyltransferase